MSCQCHEQLPAHVQGPVALCRPLLLEMICTPCSKHISSSSSHGFSERQGMAAAGAGTFVSSDQGHADCRTTKSWRVCCTACQTSVQPAALPLASSCCSAWLQVHMCACTGGTVAGGGIWCMLSKGRHQVSLSPEVQCHCHICCHATQGAGKSSLRSPTPAIANRLPFMWPRAINAVPWRWQHSHRLENASRHTAKAGFSRLQPQDIVPATT